MDMISLLFGRSRPDGVCYVTKCMQKPIWKCVAPNCTYAMCSTHLKGCYCCWTLCELHQSLCQCSVCKEEHCDETAHTCRGCNRRICYSCNEQLQRTSSGESMDSSYPDWMRCVTCKYLLKCGECAANEVYVACKFCEEERECANAWSDTWMTNVFQPNGLVGLMDQVSVRNLRDISVWKIIAQFLRNQSDLFRATVPGFIQEENRSLENWCKFWQDEIEPINETLGDLRFTSFARSVGAFLGRADREWIINQFENTEETQLKRRLYEKRNNELLQYLQSSGDDDK